MHAGHPPPLWYRSRRSEWKWLEPKPSAHRAAIAGVSLGLLHGASYDRTVLKPETDDLVVLYSDGVSEALNDDGRELGRKGLLAMAQQADTRNAQVCGSGLAAALRAFRGGSIAEDDETIIVLQRRESAN
jgi:sigma-B regulation protein RsbU (phosphoserine phosphatase)